MMNIRTLIRWTGLALVPVFGACKDAPTTPAAQTTGARASFATVADSGIGGGGGPGNHRHFVANGGFGFATWVSGGTLCGGGEGVHARQGGWHPGWAGEQTPRLSFFFLEPLHD